ncbi:MAG: DUF2203 domain-containing protein [Gemmataceae bacterium]|nr:DUF2203 domain-containing protein [Gemmataceae bacterium]
MSGSIENRASGKSGFAGAPIRLLTWHASKAMIPLVGRIAQDIVSHHEETASIRAELAALAGHGLPWPQRRRRYELEEKLAEAESALRQALAELDGLGVLLLDGPTGLVGFPTMVNQKRSNFNWRPGEDDLGWWSYAGEDERRPVPPDWISNPPRRIVRENRERPVRKSR